ncbi:MAG TPA: L-threonylcarbamoyladenylate synthase [Terracidiphilus sp.]|nr:L-threonylcarbamoyladenylate synthase [Terracidiphilus sp.]
MKTLRLIVDPMRPQSPDSDAALDRAAEILRAGGLVALPTETVYGLGANALDKAAVARIFAAKRRPAWDPIIVHIASIGMLDSLVEQVPAAARALMNTFWPGPLTLLLPRAAAVPDAVTAGRRLVGVRMPAHPVALELIRRAGVPIAAPSANLFAHISPTTAAHVLQDLDGRIDAVLDAGPSLHGLESTVLDPNTDPMTIFRPGAVTAEQIRDVSGPARFYREDGDFVDTPIESLPAPGVGLRHYAPQARLVLVDGPLSQLNSLLAQAARGCRGEQLGILLPGELTAPAGLDSSRVYEWGLWASPAEMARLLYAGLRALDAQECTVILCPLPPAEGVGEAIRDRLRKAARTE